MCYVLFPPLSPSPSLPPPLPLTPGPLPRTHTRLHLSLYRVVSNSLDHPTPATSSKHVSREILRPRPQDVSVRSWETGWTFHRSCLMVTYARAGTSSSSDSTKEHLVPSWERGGAAGGARVVWTRNNDNKARHRGRSVGACSCGRHGIYDRLMHLSLSPQPPLHPPRPLMGSGYVCWCPKLLSCARKGETSSGSRASTTSSNFSRDA